jgi:hypothetical protein
MGKDGWDDGWNPKAEVRKPREGRRAKPEARSWKAEGQGLKAATKHESPHWPGLNCRKRTQGTQRRNLRPCHPESVDCHASRGGQGTTCPSRVHALACWACAPCGPRGRDAQRPHRVRTQNQPNRSGSGSPHWLPSMVLMEPSGRYSSSITLRLRNQVLPPDGFESWWNRYHLPLNSQMEWWVVQPTTGVRMTP